MPSSTEGASQLRREVINLPEMSHNWETVARWLLLQDPANVRSNPSSFSAISSGSFSLSSNYNQILLRERAYRLFSDGFDVALLTNVFFWWGNICPSSFGIQLNEFFKVKVFCRNHGYVFKRFSTKANSLNNWYCFFLSTIPGDFLMDNLRNFSVRIQLTIYKRIISLSKCPLLQEYMTCFV